MTEAKINVARDFSRFPSGRFAAHADFSGEHFRDMILEKLKAADKVTIELDGTEFYGAAFLEEAFGGLIRNKKMTRAEFDKKIALLCEDQEILDEIKEYIDIAEKLSKD